MSFYVLGELQFPRVVEWVRGIFCLMHVCEAILSIQILQVKEEVDNLVLSQ